MRQIFVNLPVKDLERSKAFFASLGFDFDALVARAGAAGGGAVREPKDHGFMYQHAFEDPDGHIWELVHMRGQP